MELQLHNFVRNVMVKKQKQPVSQGFQKNSIFLFLLVAVLVLSGCAKTSGPYAGKECSEEGSRSDDGTLECKNGVWATVERPSNIGEVSKGLIDDFIGKHYNGNTLQFTQENQKISIIDVKANAVLTVTVRKKPDATVLGQNLAVLVANGKPGEKLTVKVTDGEKVYTGTAELSSDGDGSATVAVDQPLSDSATMVITDSSDVTVITAPLTPGATFEADSSPEGYSLIFEQPPVTTDGPVTAVCGNGIAESEEVCGEPGLSCPSGQTCTNCKCISTLLCTLNDYDCIEWSSCSNGVQTRTCTKDPVSTCTGGTSPVTTQSCTVACTWTTGSWSTCSDGQQSRTVTKASSSASSCDESNKPQITQSCTAACTWTTGSWSTCSGGQQSRSVTKAPDSPSSCDESNKPSTTQSCGPSYHEKDEYNNYVNLGVKKTFPSLSVSQTDSDSFTISSGGYVVYVVPVESPSAVYKSTIAATAGVATSHQVRYGPPALSYTDPAAGQVQWTGGADTNEFGDQQRVAIRIGPAPSDLTGTIEVVRSG